MFRYICLTVLFAFACAAPVDEGMSHTAAAYGMELMAPPSDDEVVAVAARDLDTHTPFVGIMDAALQQSTDGAYNFHYRGEDGSFRQETAQVVNPGTKDQFLKVSGTYSYFDSNGKEVVVHYKADDGGFVPEGNNILESISLAAKQNSQLPRLEENPKPQSPVTVATWNTNTSL
ncbi:endocuticle structural glycoprotein SgAbd-9 [Eurosta solidaginis]|uniref:endocuticle structural glycoprotein SgAbd-9 n=1 Tax=Eurosta solidaginis TaxID=178769 RepID=UPI0035315347